MAFLVVAPTTQAAASGSVTVQASPTSGTTGVDISSLEATATLSGTTAPPTSTSVAFTLYSDSTCNTPVPGVTGTGSLNIVNDTATYSQDWTPPMAGTYYWEASYSDSINGTATSVCSDPSSTTNQVTIGQASPTLTTAATPTTAAVGQTVKDDATLAGGSAPTGTITFTLTNASSAVVDTETATVSGNGAYATPTGYMATAPGTYQWSASYGGDTNNSSANDQGGTAKQVIIGQASPTLTTAATPTAAAVGQTVQDDATLAGGSAPTGTITFTLTNASSAVVDTETATVSGNGAYATPTGYMATAPGTYQWSASYGGDTNNSSANDQGGSAEQVIIGQASPTLTTALNSSSIAAGGTDFDTAALSGFAPGGSGSTVIYTVYSDNACSQNARTAGSVAVNESTGAVPNSNTLSFPTAGTFYWQASFSGDANNAATLSSCSSEPLTVGKASLTLTTAATPTAAAVGQTVQDDATLAGGSAPTGTITFTLTNASSAVVDTETATVSGNGAYATPTGYMATAPGTYQWSASYGGDTNNSSANDQGGSAEQVIIGQATPTLATACMRARSRLGGTDFDTATLSGFAPGGGGAHGDLHGVQRQRLLAERPGRGQRGTWTRAPGRCRTRARSLPTRRGPSTGRRRSRATPTTPRRRVPAAASR